MSGFGRDDDAGGVDRGVAGHALEPAGDASSSLTRSSFCSSSLSAGILLERLVERHVERGRDGLATLSASAYGMSITRPTSRTTARAFIVPNVMICATFSRPYFAVT